MNAEELNTEGEKTMKVKEKSIGEFLGSSLGGETLTGKFSRNQALKWRLVCKRALLIQFLWGKRGNQDCVEKLGCDEVTRRPWSTLQRAHKLQWVQVR